MVVLIMSYLAKWISIFAIGATLVSCNQDNKDFEIPSTQGIFKLKDFRGKVVVLYFGYRFCPDICPTTLNDLSRSYKAIQDQDKVQVIFISVDPERDNLDNLKEYVGFFHKDFIGATDSPAKIRVLADLYGVKYSKFYENKKETKFYSVDHSTQSFIIGKDGSLKNIIAHGEKVELITAKLKKYLQEKI
jgi:protein SCO1/2